MYGLDLTNPDIKRAYQWGFNDGYQSAVTNAQGECGLTEEQADGLLTELVEDAYHGNMAS